MQQCVLKHRLMRVTRHVSMDSREIEGFSGRLWAGTRPALAGSGKLNPNPCKPETLTPENPTAPTPGTHPAVAEYLAAKGTSLAAEAVRRLGENGRIITERAAGGRRGGREDTSVRGSENARQNVGGGARGWETVGLGFSGACCRAC